MAQIAAKKDSSGFRRLMRSDEFSVSIPLLAIMLVTTVFRPDFLSIENFSAMFTQIPFIAVVALGSAFPLMTGNVDISNGRVAGFGGILMAALVVDYHWGALPAILVALLCCCVVGLINGLLVVHFGVPDFVATMGTLYMVGGARYLFIKGYQLSLKHADGFPAGEHLQSTLPGHAAPLLGDAGPLRHRVRGHQADALGKAAAWPAATTGRSRCWRAWA